MRLKKNFAMVVVVISLQSAAWGATIFSDNFSSCANSSQNWVQSNGTQPAINCGNGAYSIHNSDTTYMQFVSHTLSGTKPTTFTLSGTITRAAGSDVAAGLFFCLSTTTVVQGYAIQIGANSTIFVTKLGTTANSIIFEQQSSAVNDIANTIAVSKQGSTFNIFCNAVFVGSFSDSDFSSGDIALLIPPASTAAFSNIVMTDQFEQGSYPTCFSDDFTSGVLTDWGSFGSPSLAGETNGHLALAADSATSAFLYTDVHVQSFVERVTAEYTAGDESAMFGLFIRGQSDTGTSIPLISFAINGNKQYAVFTSGDGTIHPVMNSNVKAAYIDTASHDTTLFSNILEVVKSANSPNFKFVINGDTLLDSALQFPQGAIPIVAAGVFCYGGLKVQFDTFSVCDVTTGVRNVPKNNVGRILGNPSENLSGAPTYDIMGRIVSRNSSQKIHNGIYFLRSGATVIRKLVVENKAGN